jgi:hypothetical protein
VPVSICFVPDGQTIQPPTVIDDLVATEINVSLMFSPELDIDHCDALLTDEGKEGFGVPDKVYFLSASSAEDTSSRQDQHTAILLSSVS